MSLRLEQRLDHEILLPIEIVRLNNVCVSVATYERQESSVSLLERLALDDRICNTLTPDGLRGRQSLSLKDIITDCLVRLWVICCSEVLEFGPEPFIFLLEEKLENLSELVEVRIRMKEDSIY
jgi:hypothetical protein